MQKKQSQLIIGVLVFLFLLGFESSPVGSNALSGPISTVQQVFLPLLRIKQLYSNPLFSTLRLQTQLRYRIVELELSNREYENVAVLNSELVRKIEVLMYQYASVSGTKKSYVPAMLVQTPSGMLLMAGKSEGVQPGSLLLSSGALVGVTDAVQEHTSSVLLLLDGTLTTAVLHQGSRSSAILTKEGKAIVATFLAAVPVSVGDHFVTLGDGVVEGGVPIGVVDEVLTQPADPRTKVRIRLTSGVTLNEIVLVQGVGQ